MLPHNDAVSLLGSCRCACHIARSSRAAQQACWCDPGRVRRRVAAPDPVDGTGEPEDVAVLRAHVERAGGWWAAPVIAHNDAVRHLRSCWCVCHFGGGPCTCRSATDPVLAQAMRRADDRALRKRLMTGRARPEEYLRHAPHLLPGRRPRP